VGGGKTLALALAVAGIGYSGMVIGDLVL